MGSGSLAPRDGFDDRTLVAIKLAGYLSLGYTRIILDEDRSPFCPGQIMRCVHGQNIKIQALLSLLQWLFIGRRQTIHWELITIPKSQLKLSKFHMNRHGYTARRQNIFSVICCDYVTRLYNIENRYFVRIWLWSSYCHISSICHTKFWNNSCNFLEEIYICAAVSPRVDHLNKVMPDFWMTVYYVSACTIRVDTILLLPSKCLALHVYFISCYIYDITRNVRANQKGDYWIWIRAFRVHSCHGAKLVTHFTDH